MLGKHHIIVESKRLKYEFDIKRNITVVLGDSATGKTTLIDMLSSYGRFSEGSGIRVESDVPCVVYSQSGGDWRTILENIHSSIIFIDEDYSFVFSEDFAALVKDSTDYFVIITRRPLYNLPYSVNEIYGIRTSGKYHFPEQIYHEFYKIYDMNDENQSDDKYTFYLEDSRAGYDFYKNVFGDKICRSFDGNSNISKVLNDEAVDNAIVIADGAAFGAFIEDLINVTDGKSNIIIYLPESFEWLVLKSGIVEYEGLGDILDAPERFIRSEEYFSWERYFTALLQHATEGDPVRRYSKLKLVPFYYTGSNRDAILSVMPEEIRMNL